MAEKTIIDKYIDALINNTNPAVLIAANRLQGQITYRIHNSAQATDGRSLGPYKSAQYARKRKRAGRQTRVKDLEFTGELRRSFVVGTVGGNVAIGFDNDTAALIADGQQNQIGVEIWPPSEREIADAVEIIVQEILNFR